MLLLILADICLAHFEDRHYDKAGWRRPRHVNYQQGFEISATIPTADPTFASSTISLESPSITSSVDLPLVTSIPIHHQTAATYKHTQPAVLTSPEPKYQYVSGLKLPVPVNPAAPEPNYRQATGPTRPSAPTYPEVSTGPVLQNDHGKASSPKDVNMKDQGSPQNLAPSSLSSNSELEQESGAQISKATTIFGFDPVTVVFGSCGVVLVVLGLIIGFKVHQGKRMKNQSTTDLDRALNYPPEPKRFSQTLLKRFSGSSTSTTTSTITSIDEVFTHADPSMIANPVFTNGYIIDMLNEDANRQLPDILNEATDIPNEDVELQLPDIPNEDVELQLPDIPNEESHIITDMQHLNYDSKQQPPNK
jgi:hypothetical protein